MSLVSISNISVRIFHYKPQILQQCLLCSIVRGLCISKNEDDLGKSGSKSRIVKSRVKLETKEKNRKDTRNYFIDGIYFILV